MIKTYCASYLFVVFSVSIESDRELRSYTHDNLCNVLLLLSQIEMLIQKYEYWQTQ